LQFNRKYLWDIGELTLQLLGSFFVEGLLLLQLNEVERGEYNESKR
jgi:hypothetical protein